ncbi:MAG: transcriptional regulator [Desulfobulbaceae bacterium]|nr:MAG: transcriptional regulator [Desulfobulbaceae bacterium]
MAIPKPGQPVRGSQSGAPIMAIFDLLGRRWAMGIIWNLSRGPSTFRLLQSYCETISPSMLNNRLKELREAKLITRTLDGYELTEMGEELFALLKPFGIWSLSWAEKVAPEFVPPWNEANNDKETT